MELIPTENITNGNSKLAKSTRAKGKLEKKTLNLPAPAPTPQAIAVIPQELIQAGISQKLLDALVSRVAEFQAIKEEAQQQEYLIQIAAYASEEAGKDEGKKRAQQEIAQKEQAKIKETAQKWFDKIDSYFEALLTVYSFQSATEKEREQILEKIKVDLIQQAKGLYQIDLKIELNDGRLEFEGLFIPDGEPL